MYNNQIQNFAAAKAVHLRFFLRKRRTLNIKPKTKGYRESRFKLTSRCRLSTCLRDLGLVKGFQLY